MPVACRSVVGAPTLVLFFAMDVGSLGPAPKPAPGKYRCLTRCSGDLQFLVSRQDRLRTSSLDQREKERNSSSSRSCPTLRTPKSQVAVESSKFKRFSCPVVQQQCCQGQEGQEGSRISDLSSG
ncbi:hypothetical protein FB451DRAFT_685360 [Mycena latifolia]|nr:hypothetical protein FB451DRAFT_685360 [Mycena latifolia]